MLIAKKYPKQTTNSRPEYLPDAAFKSLGYAQDKPTASTLSNNTPSNHNQTNRVGPQPRPAAADGAGAEPIGLGGG